MSSKKTILIIEDEAPIREMLRFILTQADFIVTEAEDNKQAMAYLFAKRPDLILLDWMLPGVSGIEIARHLKKDQRTKDIPLIMLTARATEDNKVKGLEVGADDYIVKPFSPRELVARINAVFRRLSPSAEQLTIAGLRLDPESQRLFIEEAEIKIGTRDYQLLYFLMGHPGRVYTRAQLLDRVWQTNEDLDERAVDACIRRLRKALGAVYQQIIETVHGTGYRLNDKAFVQTGTKEN
jgi:two-component system phosphate regulon response regulator PhoB